MTTVRHDDRSLGELFSELSQQTSTLIQKEIALARHEVVRSATEMGRNGALIGVGGAIAYAGFIVLLIGFGWLLTDLGLPIWLSMLLVGIVVIGIGGFLAWRAVQELRSAKLRPERTIETMQDNVQWAKEQAK